MIDLVALKAKAVGLLVGAAVTVGAVFVLHRRRIRQRDAHLYRIPNFLRGTADPGDATDTRLKGNWTASLNARAHFMRRLRAGRPPITKCGPRNPDRKRPGIEPGRRPHF